MTALMAAVGACAASPAFRAALPERIDVGGKAIAIIGDLQQTPRFIRFVRRREGTRTAQQALIEDLRSRADDLATLIVVGDLVYTARSRRDWQHFDALMTDIVDRATVLPAVGNHDYPCVLVMLCRTEHIAAGMAARFPWLVPGEPWSVTADRLLLLFIDSESRLDEQARWLERQLELASGTHAAALVFFHRPPWTNSVDKTATGNESVRNTIVPVLSAAQLPTVVFNGHIHGFEHFRHDGVDFITTGGGGGPRVAMPDRTADLAMQDSYTGPECELGRDGSTARPFNYLLLRATEAEIAIDVFGLCTSDESVRLLYSTSTAL